MSAPPVKFVRDGAIGRVILNRPEVLNALDESMALALRAVCRELQSSAGLRVVVLSGEGRSFMAGGDLARFQADMPNAPRTAVALIQPLNDALAILAALPQPVLASVQGPLAGAGVSLMLGCDLALAADTATFNLAYARVGASLDGSSSWTLPRVVGLRKSLELALLAETVDATEALRLGLVNRVVPAAELAERTEELAQRLAAGPTVAYGNIKQLLRAAGTSTLQEQMDRERDLFSRGTRSGDFQEGVQAFFNRRPAAFTGS
jgi:2-(1,2-epoxy-1,2-dihydrophenyl)acetyl-CoA isomerase